MAGAGLAQTTDTLGTLTDLTCEEAKKTEDAKLILEFCEEEASESPLTKSVNEVTKTTDKTVKQVQDTVAPKPDGDGDGGKEGGQTGGGDKGGSTTPDPTKVLGSGGGDGGKTPGGTEVEGSGNNFNPVDEGNRDGARSGGGNARQQPQGGISSRNVPEGFNYPADPFLPGMQSQSALTLQPFAGPIVSAPPVYELPQIAQELFGTTAPAGAEAPQIAGAPGSTTTATAASSYAPAGFSATSADPTGWLAATATGLIMLVGAGHALTGGRTARREKA